MIESMLKTSARLLELLSLLQLKRDWTSSELAGRLDVSTRTIRADIGRLLERVERAAPTGDMHLTRGKPQLTAEHHAPEAGH